MATTNEIPRSHGGGAATHFIVEVKTDHGVRYAICERLMLVEGGADSLPPAVIEQYLTQHALRAAPIPTTGDGDGGRWGNLVQMFQSGRAPLIEMFQSGRAPSVSVVVNNYPPSPPPPPPKDPPEE